MSYELVERGEVDHGSPVSRRFFYQKEAAVEAGIRIGYDLQGSLRYYALDFLTEGESTRRVEPVHWKRYRGPGEGGGGEAGPGRGFDIPLKRLTPPRVLLLLSAIASSAVTDTPLPEMESRDGQVGRFPDPFRLPPELPDHQVVWEKGLLHLRDLLFLPLAEEDEEGL